MELSTEKKLMIAFGNTHISLETARIEYLPHLSEAVIKRRAKVQSLPWPVIKVDDSNKAKLLVSIKAIAEWLDSKEAEAKDEWQKINH